MSVVQRRLSKSFEAFFDAEKASGIVLIICTVISLVTTNFILGKNYFVFWQMYVGGLSIEHWINDALMAIFFLLIGLELERELYNGELSNFKNCQFTGYTTPMTNSKGTPVNYTNTTPLYG